MKNKNFVYVADVILIIGILMSVSCISITQYFMGKQHTDRNKVIEINPTMRKILDNEETFETFPEDYQRAVNYKWNWLKTLSLSHVFIIIPYFLVRRRVVKRKYEEDFNLWLLFTLSAGIFLMNLLNFANDMGYLVGRLLG
jgi:hypothetical protein